MGWRWGGNDGTAFLARYKETFYLPRRGGTQSLLLVMPSSFHRCLSQPLSTFLEQLFHLLFATDAEDRFRRFIPPFTARYLSPVGNLCDARYSFPTLFFLSSPFSFFFFLPFALIMYRATLPLSLSVSAIKGKKHLELFTLLAL